MNFIPREQYEEVLQSNPELKRHPEFLKSTEQNSRDFKIPESARMSIKLKEGVSDVGMEADQYAKNAENNFNSLEDGTYGDAHRMGSVYFDAYEGNEMRD